MLTPSQNKRLFARPSKLYVRTVDFLRSAMIGDSNDVLFKAERRV